MLEAKLKYLLKALWKYKFLYRIGFTFCICTTLCLKTKQAKNNSFTEASEACQAQLYSGGLLTSRELASSGTSFVFENKGRKSFYKVKNPFVHKIITSYFICFVSLDFCILSLVKVKHTPGKNKSLLLCSTVHSTVKPAVSYDQNTGQHTNTFSVCRNSECVLGRWMPFQAHLLRSYSLTSTGLSHTPSSLLSVVIILSLQ